MNKLFLFVFLSILSTHIYADKKKKIIFSTVQWAPFRIVSEKEKVSGNDAEIVEEVFNRIGYEVEYRVAPYLRSWELVKKGKVAGFVSLTKNKQRERFALFPEKPLSTVKDVFFKRKSDDITFDKFTDLKNYTVGESGYNYPKPFKDALKNNVFKKVETIITKEPEILHLRKLSAKRIDLFVCEASVCSYLINSEKYKNKFKNIDFIDKPVGDIRPFYVAFSKKWPDIENIIKAFNTEFNKYIAEGKRKAKNIKYNLAVDLK